ncbi:MAG: DUF2975 domain-containing protein [Pseudomonadota bacterium]
MSDELPNDGLLKAANILIFFLQVALGLGFVALLVASPVVLASHEHFADEMLAEATASTFTVAATIVSIMAIGAILVALAFVFLRQLKQIVASVEDGDPFVAENADRLTRMGWIAVAIELLKIPGGAIAIFLHSQLNEDTFKADLEFSFTGVLIALSLFILARVFNHGAAMRDDLEGTV